jgi:hypothetical protein
LQDMLEELLLAARERSGRDRDGESEEVLLCSHHEPGQGQRLVHAVVRPELVLRNVLALSISHYIGLFVGFFSKNIFF